MSMISIEGVSRSYGSYAVLAGIDLEVAAGEVVTLLGPSGCGKTTLLRLLAGFDFPTDGAIAIDGQDVTRLAPERRPVNMVFQRYALFPHLDVFDNIAFGLHLKKVPEAQVRRRVLRMIEVVQLGGLENRWVGQLSGGQSQRVALARALVNAPKVLLLDEPLAALDLKIRQHMLAEIRRIHREMGTTFVYVTHDQDEAMTLSNRIVLMNQGRVVQIDAPEALYAAPRTLFAACFLGDANLLPATLRSADTVVLGSGQAMQVAPAAPGNVAGGPVTVLVRPEAVRLAPEGNGAGDTERLGGVVTDVVYCGKRILYTVAADAGYTLLAEESSSGMPARPAVGTRVEASWAATAGIVIGEGLPN